MTDSHKENYRVEYNANNGDFTDAYKYTHEMNKLRDSAIGFGKEQKYNSLLIFLVGYEIKKGNGLSPFHC